MPCEDPEVFAEASVEQVACFDCEGDGMGELCTPFCECQCCSIHYISFEAGNFHMIHPFVAQGKFVFMDSQQQEVLHPFDHPPRV
jgi:hypothetical protein